MNNIKIQELCDEFDIQFTNHAKKALKKIIEVVIDKCAEKANTKSEYIGQYEQGTSSSITNVDKDSILKVKKLINYE